MTPAKLCFLDTTGQMHVWTHRGATDRTVPHGLIQLKISSWAGRWDEVPPRPEEPLLNDSCCERKGESDFIRFVASVSSAVLLWMILLPRRCGQQKLKSLWLKEKEKKKKEDSNWEDREGKSILEELGMKINMIRIYCMKLLRKQTF